MWEKVEKKKHSREVWERVAVLRVVWNVQPAYAVKLRAAGENKSIFRCRSSVGFVPKLESFMSHLVFWTTIPNQI